jgi:tetratricopeptide (TPR) repeat protein
MFPHQLPPLTRILRTILLSLATIVLCAAATPGQPDQNLSELKSKAAKLMEETKYTEALPLLEKIVAAEPGNPETHLRLGFALLAKVTVTKNEDEQRKLRLRARDAFIKAKELGTTEPKIDGLIQSIPPDGSAGAPFSSRTEAARLMQKAEASFSQGKLDDALRDYQKALEIDPTLYEAALFSGDVFVQKQDFAQAEVWYQRAIKINPNRETAYRYSATPFMKQRKYDEARDRYIEAYISEPYSNFSIGGMTQWAQITRTPLGHPRIEIPSDVKFDEKGNAQINLDMNVLTGGKEDGSFAWMAYGTTRSLWHKEKFAKTFPNEKTYRHSLPEEIEALQSVIALATSDKAVKNLNPTLAQLKKLNDAGLLEAFILLAKADRGLAQDHAAYLKANRDKLRRYVLEYVITAGGR